MKKITAILVLGLIVSSYGFSQTSVWEIRKDDKKIYLGGSVHALRKKDFPLPREFDAAFANSNVLVLEADVKDTKAMGKILSEGMLPAGKTLKSVLTKQQYAAISKIAAKIGIPIELVETMKLGVALMTIESTAIVNKIGASAQGVDMYYYNKAAEKQKKVDFLESMDFQVSLMCNTPFDIDEFIDYSVGSINTLNVKKEFDKLINDWRTGNTNGEMAVKEITEMQEKYPSVYKAMCLDRNYKWLPKIEKYFENDNTTFVIVGVAHLWGSDGLLNLLKEKGYEVEQFHADK